MLHNTFDNKSTLLQVVPSSKKPLPEPIIDPDLSHGITRPQWVNSIPHNTVSHNYHQTSNISCTLAGNKLVDHSDVVGASPVGAAPTTSSFSTKHLASMHWTETTARRDENNLSLGIWCILYQRSYGTYPGHRYLLPAPNSSYIGVKGVYTQKREGWLQCSKFISLWPSDTIWWQRSGSTLAQAMACCLTAPSHYLSQCWLIINEVQWHSY